MSSKHYLDDAKDEFLRGKNREQERQERSCGGGGQTRDVLESEGDRTHLAHEGIAIAKICERLDIGSSEKFLARRGVAEDPFLFEVFYIALSEQAVIGQSFSFCTSHLGSKHQEWTENGQDEKGYKATDL
jgi:hypothetical protein